MLNWFFELFKKVGSDGRNLDSILNSLPWKLKEIKSDGTEHYECEIKN